MKNIFEEICIFLSKYACHAKLFLQLKYNTNKCSGPNEILSYQEETQEDANSIS
jgi:hypothetical protein